MEDLHSRYKFNETFDVDLVTYKKLNVQDFRQRESSGIKLKGSSSVVQVFQPVFKQIEVAVPYQSPEEATRSFLRGLKELLLLVNQKLKAQTSIDVEKFSVTEYAKIRASSTESLYFPVEVKQCLKVNEEEFIICLNFDNPTSLPEKNQETGYQGSHFGYTIISKGQRIRGHVLITTFIGFPSRNESEKSAILDEIRTANSPKLISFHKLCQAATTLRSLPFDITTELGMTVGSYDDLLTRNKRIKKLPDDIQRLHVTLTNFRLPNTESDKIKFYFES